jgi:hypothetical protein
MSLKDVPQHLSRSLAMRKGFAVLVVLVFANFALAQNKPLACQTDATAGLNWEAPAGALLNAAPPFDFPPPNVAFR